MAVSVFGINYKYAGLETLEQITFRPQEVMDALPILRREEGIRECVMLSTCNRLEIYTVSDDNLPVEAVLYSFLKHAKPVGMEDIWDQFYFKQDRAAIEHLFTVASGLDSLVLGENEITGQVKTAYRIACDLKTNGMLTNKLFHAAFKTAKRVRTETRINEGNCSVGAVAVDIAAEVFQNLQDCRALVIGAGEIGRVVAKTLAARQTRQIIIANRSFPKAVALAEEVGGTAIPLEEVFESIGQVDIVVSGTGAPVYLLRHADLRDILEHAPQRRRLFVDIALPRDFDPEIGALPNVLLNNLYDLKAIVDRNLQQREQEIPRVKQIISEELEQFLLWKESQKVSAAIQSLHQYFETIRAQELERYQHQFSDEARVQVDSFTKTLTKKYMHIIISNLKSLHQVCELNTQHIHIIQHLFDSEGLTDERTHCRLKRKQSGVDSDALYDCAASDDDPGAAA